MSINITDLLFQLVILVFSVIIHEVSHGIVAEKLGDSTARLAGRLTLNPMAHISVFGMVIFPIISWLVWGIPVGAAKPVPYNQYNLKNPRRGGAIIALAGPLSNIVIALIFGIILRFLGGEGRGILENLRASFNLIIYINIFLAVFNLVPIPPLDGSKVINLILPGRLGFYWDSFWHKFGVLIRENQFIFLIILIFFFRYILEAVFFVISPLIGFLYLLISGKNSV